MTLSLDGAVLRGNLHCPNVESLQPCVVLLHGAAWGERRFYKAFVDRFTAEGMAVLAFDRRGSGDSTGEGNMDITRWADDAGAVRGWAAARPEIDSARVALWGYSNGAWVAAAAAARVDAPGALVMAGASAVSPYRAEVFRRVTDLRSQGIGAETLAAVEEAWTLIFECVGAGLFDDDRQRRLAVVKDLILADTKLEALPVPAFVMANPLLDSVPRFDRPPLDGDLASMAGTVPSMAYDPVPDLRKLRWPTLVVLAENDENLPVSESVRIFSDLARSRPVGEFEVVVVQGVGHAFTRQPMADRDGGASPLPLTAADFAPGYLDTMASWLARRLGASGTAPAGR